MIKDNLDSIEQRITDACLRSGRDRSEVKLIAVSKTKPVSMIEEAVGLGQLRFGENRPQELRDKALALPETLQWHMIGRLQINKVKYVVGTACMIHSIDTLRLAEAVSSRAQSLGIVVPVLAQVNMSGEESKSGAAPEQTEALVRGLASLPGISVRGLMTIAPYTTEPETNRVYFRELRKLSIDIASKNIDNISMCELSMGMSGDFEIAVEEGATFVRIGTGIFGSR